MLGSSLRLVPLKILTLKLVYTEPPPSHQLQFKFSYPHTGSIDRVPFLSLFLVSCESLYPPISPTLRASVCPMTSDGPKDWFLVCSAFFLWGWECWITSPSHARQENLHLLFRNQSVKGAGRSLYNGTTGLFTKAGPRAQTKDLPGWGIKATQTSLSPGRRQDHLKLVRTPPLIPVQISKHCTFVRN